MNSDKHLDLLTQYIYKAKNVWVTNEKNDVIMLNSIFSTRFFLTRDFRALPADAQVSFKVRLQIFFWLLRKFNAFDVPVHDLTLKYI